MPEGDSIASAIDLTDPIVMLIAWMLTDLARRFADDAGYKRIRHLLPALAVLIAVLIRTTVVTVYGQDIDLWTILRAVGAGACAVVLHSQYREVVKALLLLRCDDGADGANDAGSADSAKGNDDAKRE